MTGSKLRTGSIPSCADECVVALPESPQKKSGSPRCSGNPGALDIPAAAPRRRCWQITGQVQGVGFRPNVYRLAMQWHVTGFVRNDAVGVTVEAQGPGASLAAFSQAFLHQLPPLARIHSCQCVDIPIRKDETGFRIQLSRRDESQLLAAVAVDTSVCDDCVRELLTESDRRAGYALINCTNCGPRYTILRQVPYDRQNTTMASFPLCPSCASEYKEPTNRRFHAQPTACPTCGPRLQWVSPRGATLAGDPILGTARLLQAGKIVAIKGLGGFHLAVRADAEQAVARLRERKQRDAKPFALLVASLARAEQLVVLGEAAKRLLLSPSRPIVLAPRRIAQGIAAAVAPESHRLGVMLPYTPIHYLLFAQLAGLDTLVMTSGNESDEPLVIDNAEAVQRLGGLCDAILWHDRPIHRCVDDSVVIDCGAAAPLFVRRSRGFAPQSLLLTHAKRPVARPLCRRRA